jgi:hypothetical protein
VKALAAEMNLRASVMVSIYRRMDFVSEPAPK